MHSNFAMAGVGVRQADDLDDDDAGAHKGSCPRNGAAIVNLLW